ncbi:MAG TPA: MarR family transcriptional regulator [Solirubrobacteraceae bacterium]
MSTSASSKREQQLDYVAEHLLSRAAVLVRLLVKQVRSKEVSRTEMQVLGLLDEGPRRITELTELEGTAQPTMTLLVKRLEKKGWVEREGLPDDGRVALISLTEAGRAAWRRFRAQFLAAMRADLDVLSEEQLGALLDATETLGSFLDELQRRVGR